LKLTPKHIIFIAVTNYISDKVASDIKNELSRYQRLPSQKFIELIEKYFDFNILKDNPIIPEDVWLYNYLMYDNKKKGKISFVPVDRIIIEGRFKVTKLLMSYEKKVIIPQLLTLKQAGRILDDSAAM
jgi:hypothetical protein